MAQTYSLEEAAEKIGIPADDFKKRLKTDTDYQKLRSFRDGATLRFRSADIDELARSLGGASDPGLALGDLGAPPQSASSDEFLLPNDLGTPIDNSNDDIFSFSAGDSGKTPPKRGSDSDIRLDFITPKGSNDPNAGITEEIDLDLSAGTSGSSTRLTAPKSGPNLGGPLSSTRIPGPPPSNDLMSGDSSSEFELSLDADSDSFELQLNTDQSEEIDLGNTVGNSPSGVNLSNPKDSGVSLESSAEMATSDSDDFELSLDSDSSLDDIGALASSRQKNDSDSEFELSLDAGSSETDSLSEMLSDEVTGQQGDIFETDFELPAVTDDADSGSEVVAVESSDTDLENSDFDLALDESDIQAVDDDESASQVVLLDEESSDEDSGGGRAGLLAAGAAAAGAAGLAARGRKRAASDDVEMVYDDEDGAASALKGVSRREMEDDAEPKGYAPPAKWGPLPAMVLLPCFFLTTIGGLMSFELLKGMWGYHNNQSTSGSLANGVASMLVGGGSAK